MSPLLWWGYLHINGTIHVKRYFGPIDTTEARKSPFVQYYYGPFVADSREEAEKILKDHFKEAIA